MQTRKCHADADANANADANGIRAKIHVAWGTYICRSIDSVRYVPKIRFFHFLYLMITPCNYFTGILITYNMH